MKTTFKIMRNELRMLFCSPIAWIVLVIFFFHCGSSFCEAIEPNLRWKAQGYDLETLTYDLFVGWRGLFRVMLDKIFIYFPLLRRLPSALVSQSVSAQTMMCCSLEPTVRFIWLIRG